jgi:hypothetical protein
LGGIGAHNGELARRFQPLFRQQPHRNDVTADVRGLFYLLDRLRGLTILERCQGTLRYVEPALDSARAVGRNGLPI